MRMRMKGQTKTLAMDKSETRRLCEAGWLLRAAADITGDSDLATFADGILARAKQYGAKYFDSDGEFIESAANQRINDSAPA